MADKATSRWSQFPFKQVAVVGAILFSEDFGGSVIYPILPFLTHDFYSYLKSNQLGYHAGFLTSGHYLGNFLGSFVWGKLADKFGRRPTLLAGSISTILTYLMFGFSFSFAWAVFILFLGGLLGGNLGIAKTYLYEMCPSKMHAAAFAVVSVASGLAHVVGPTVGGFLSCPAARYPSLDTPAFRRFPYLLPCIASIIVAFLGLLVGFFFLEESKQKGRKGGQITAMEEINLSVLGSDLRADGTRDKLQDGAATSENYGTMADSGNQEQMTSDGTDKTRDLQGKFHDVGSTLAGYQRMEEGEDQESDSWPLSRLMWDRRVVLSSVLYGLLAFVTIAVAQLLPLLLISGYKHGGFNMDSSQVSIVATVLGVAVLVDQVLIVPWLARRFKYTTLYKCGLLVFAFGVLLIPLTASMTGPSTVIFPPSENLTATTTTAIPLPLTTLAPTSQRPSPSGQTIMYSSTTPSTPPQVPTTPAQAPSSTSPPQAPVVPATQQATTTAKTQTTTSSATTTTSSYTTTPTTSKAPTPVPQTTNIPTQKPSSPVATTSPASKAPVPPAQIPNTTPQGTTLSTAVQTSSTPPTQPTTGSSTGTLLSTKSAPPPQAPTPLAQLGSDPSAATAISTSNNGKTSRPTGQCKIINDTTKKDAVTRIPPNIWAAVILINIIVIFGSSTAFTAVMVMIGNSALPSFRGSANGIAQTTAALARLLGPVIFGNLFAWSTDNGLPWPLSYHLSFILVILLSLLATFLCTRLPDSINSKREEEILQAENNQEGDQGFYEDGAEDYYASQALH